MRIFRYPFLHFAKVRCHNLVRGTLFEISGQRVNNIDFIGRFMELIDNISQQAASGSEHAVNDISDKVTIRFREMFGNLIRKR